MDTSCKLNEKHYLTMKFILLDSFSSVIYNSYWDIQDLVNKLSKGTYEDPMHNFTIEEKNPTFRENYDSAN